jgi:hypothetical protein
MCHCGGGERHLCTGWGASGDGGLGSVFTDKMPEMSKMGQSSGRGTGLVKLRGELRFLIDF